MLSLRQIAKSRLGCRLGPIGLYEPVRYYYTPTIQRRRGVLLIPYTNSRRTQFCRSFSNTNDTKKSSSWYNKWFKKNKSSLNGTWEETDVESTEIWDQTARRLKEELIKAKNTRNIDAQTIQSLLSDLVDQSPENRINPKYLPIVEVAYSMTVDSGLTMSNGYLEKLFQSITAKNDPKEIKKFSIITKLFSKIYNSGGESALYNALYYAKFLRAQQKIEESQKLLIASFKQTPHLINGDFIISCIQGIKETASDTESLSKLLSIAIDNSPNLPLEVYHEAVAAFSEISANEKNSSEKFSKFIESFILNNRLFPISEATEETIVLILDACLTLETPDVGKKVLKSMAIPMLENLNPPNNESLLQLYELILMSSSKFRVEPALGRQIIDQLYSKFDEKTDFVKETWDVIIQWTAYESTELDSVKQLISNMENVGISPDQNTLNGVIMVSFGRTNHYIKSTVDYFNKELDVESDVETFSLLIKRTLLSSDEQHKQSIDTAEKLFERSLSEGCSWDSKDGKFLPTLDELLIALCNMPESVDTHRVFKIFKKVKMFTKTIGYDAQVAMLKMFLDGEFIPDAGRFLEDELGDNKRDSTRNDLPYYQVPDMYEAMYKYIMTSNDYKSSWLLYGYMNRFIKLPYESYYPTMKRFCELQRPDAALIIFKYLRARNKKEGMMPPNEEIYIMLFNEFGRMLYEEGVRTLHLFYKMDLSIDTNINLQNALMSAYSKLEEDDKVMELWSQTETFPEINHDTATIMIKHLTRASSINDVESFWLGLPESYNLTPTADNLRQYIIANCYHGYYMRALNISKDMEDVYGIQPTEEIIEALYNWSLLESRKEQVEKWAIDNHPQEWKALQGKGSLKTYVLPENKDNNSDEALRAEAIGLLEGEKSQQNKYMAGELPGN